MGPLQVSNQNQLRVLEGAKIQYHRPKEEIKFSQENW